MNQKQVDPISPGEDERYTVEYIEREAIMFVKYVLRKKPSDYGSLNPKMKEVDKRICERWGIR